MNSRKRQSHFDFEQEKLSFGGDLLKDKKNRHARPFSSRNPIHLIIKSTKAKGRYSFLSSQNKNYVNRLFAKACEKYGIKIIEYSNNGNHLHAFLKFPSRTIYLRFIRSVTGQIAMAVTKTKKLSSLKLLFGKKGFFDRRPFTRIVRGGLKNFKTARDYVKLNALEAAGKIPKRDARLKGVTTEEWSLFSTARGQPGSILDESVETSELNSEIRALRDDRENYGPTH